MLRLKTPLLALSFLVLSQSLLRADFYLGRGCSTIYWIDGDCDGYPLTGGRDGNVGPDLPGRPVPLFFTPDANDNDITLTTTQSARDRYNQLASANDIKNYLRDRGYQHTINNIYFISLTGNNSTAQPNDPNRPYRTPPRPTALNASPTIVAGDVVMYRGGVYPDMLQTFARETFRTGEGTQPEGYRGTAAQPVLVINYPGERVIFRGNDLVPCSPTKYTEYTIIDGFEFDGTKSTGYAREAVSLYTTPLHNLTIKNCELRNTDQFGLLAGAQTGRDNLVLDSLVIHHTLRDQGIHRNERVDVTEVDTGWVLKNSLIYNTGKNGVEWRGGSDFQITNNIIHSCAYSGIDFRNGAVNGVISNNLIFNTALAPLSIRTTDEPQRVHNGNQNLRFVNNIFLGKNGTNGFSSNSGPMPAVSITHDSPSHPLHRQLEFFNNVVMTDAYLAFDFGDGREIPQTRMENNIFYRTNSPAAHDQAGQRTCGWTDGSHTQQVAEWDCPQAYYWDYAAMMDPVRRPQFVNNIFRNPGFTDVNNQYTRDRTPWRYNFLPTATSLTVDFALATVAPSSDLRGRSRVGRPDAGTYEYSLASTNNPPVVNAGDDQTILWPIRDTQLSGIVTDDGRPDPPGTVSLQWSKNSGPGTVDFSNPSSAATSASFSAPGVYELRLSATDGALITTDATTITILEEGRNDPPSSEQKRTALLPCANPADPAQKDQIPLCLQLENTGTVKIEMFSRTGKLVRKVFEGILEAGSHTIPWDKKDNSGQLVGTGIYTAIMTWEGSKTFQQKVAVLN